MVMLLHVHTLYYTCQVQLYLLCLVTTLLDSIITPFCISTASSTIEQAIRDGTQLGKEVCFIQMVYHHLSTVYEFPFVRLAQAKARLVKGEQLSEEMVANIITEKLSTPEVAYYGQHPCSSPLCICNYLVLMCCETSKYDIWYTL